MSVTEDMKDYFYSLLIELRSGDTVLQYPFLEDFRDVSRI